jgi:hypothetical protein
MARPTKALAKTMADLPEDWREILKEWGEKGYSQWGLFTKLGLTKKVHDRFIMTEQEYAEWFSFALDLAKSYWIDEVGEKLVKDRQLNSAIYAIQVRNRYGWKQTDEQKPTPPAKEKEEPVDDLIVKHKKSKPEEKPLITN